MNPQMKTLLFGGLLSLAGYVVGTIAFAVVGNLLLHGIQATLDVFLPGALIGMALGTAVQHQRSDVRRVLHDVRDATRRADCPEHAVLGGHSTLRST